MYSLPASYALSIPNVFDLETVHVLKADGGRIYVRSQEKSHWQTQLLFLL